MMKLYGGIEGGGTKFVCGVGRASGKVEDKVTIPTTTPEETLPQVIAYFKAIHEKTPLSALGVASFGPLDPSPHSPTYGYILATPKPGWAQFDFLGALKQALDMPMGFDTDVNGAALGEFQWGGGQGLRSFIYITVGTGIGAGGLIEGNLMHGLIHPEMGHIFIPQDLTKDTFEGVCPYHGNCLEGLASGPSIKKRWAVKFTRDLPPDHAAWALESDYLACAIANYVMTLSPERIIIGGGVMKQTQLFPMIREKVLAKLNGYIKHDTLQNHIDEYIIPPGLGDLAGLSGALALAMLAEKNHS